MADHYRRPDLVRRLNAMGDSVGGAQHLVPLNADGLLAAAVDAAGHDDFGDFDDGDWEPRFRHLVERLDTAARLNTVGRLMTRQELLRGLGTRLNLVTAMDADPTWAGEQVEAPVIVTGPARSGTTILFELLALDPAMRAPAAWEVLHPAGPGTAGDRLAWSEGEQELWANVQPEFAAIHELRSDLPVECVTVTIPSFAGTHWLMVADIPGWPGDTEANYRYERTLLRFLQHGDRSATWLLKTPSHLMTLEQLFVVFPDAWVVQTHRDPVRTMPSTVSTTAMVKWLRSDDVDVAGTTAGILAAFNWALGAVTQRRRDDPGAQFADVHFSDLVADPVDAIGRAYEQMGRAFSDAHAGAIADYVAAKPKGKFGTHRYTPADYGLGAEGLRTDLADYIEHFGVALEEDPT